MRSGLELVTAFFRLKSSVFERRRPAASGYAGRPPTPPAKQLGGKRSKNERKKKRLNPELQITPIHTDMDSKFRKLGKRLGNGRLAQSAQNCRGSLPS
jgi:hypothetical protein